MKNNLFIYAFKQPCSGGHLFNLILYLNYKLMYNFTATKTESIICGY